MIVVTNNEGTSGIPVTARLIVVLHRVRDRLVGPCRRSRTEAG